MISLKKSFVYKDLCYLMSLWSVKLPLPSTYVKIGNILILMKTKIGELQYEVVHLDDNAVLLHYDIAQM